MKYCLQCPVKNCLFETELDYDASEAECVEATTRFKNHLKSHGVDVLADTLFRFLMTFEEST